MKLITANQIKLEIKKLLNSIEQEEYDFDKRIEKKEKSKKVISQAFNISVKKVEVEPEYFFRTLEEDSWLLEELKKKIITNQLDKKR